MIWMPLPQTSSTQADRSTKMASAERSNIVILSCEGYVTRRFPSVRLVPAPEAKEREVGRCLLSLIHPFSSWRSVDHRATWLLSMASSTKMAASSAKPTPDTIGINYMQKNFVESDSLGQGYLTKIGQRWKSHKRRWFVVTFQEIKYFENRVRSPQFQHGIASNSTHLFSSFFASPCGIQHLF